MPPVNLMPRKTNLATKKPQSKTKFILAQPKTMLAKDVVAKGKGAGMTFTEKYVWQIRSAAKQKGNVKKAKVVPALMKTKPGKVRRAVRKAAPRPALSQPMPRPSAVTIAGIEPLDLAYAVGRLVAAGRTTAAEIIKLAAERAARIMALKTELAALKGGEVPAAEVVKQLKATKLLKSVAKAKGRTIKTKSKATKGTVVASSSGRRYTMTPKALAARQLQGKYMGYLRQVPEAEKAKFKAIAKEKGIPVAVAELKNRLGKK